MLESSDSLIKNILLLLGNFHTTYNLLGCIGKLMAGSGLSDVLCEVYGESTVSQMLSGKAYSRALRGHLIVDQVLTTLLLEKMTGDNREIKVITNNLEQIFTDLLDSKITICDLQNNPSMRKRFEQLTDIKQKLELMSPTASLWLQYSKIVEVIRKLITADRTGNWDLHLEAIQEALPIFAAAGHHNYSKSAYMYLQSMINLESSNQKVYTHL